MGSKGDSFDNALAESFNGLYKWELIYNHGPWSGIDEVEFATMEYVDWFNNRRLHTEITPGPRMTTPGEFAAAYYVTRSWPRGRYTQTRVSRKPGAVQ